MIRRYDAFLVRYWALDGNATPRVEVTHIRSGARALLASWDNATGWMRKQAAANSETEQETGWLDWSDRSVDGQ